MFAWPLITFALEDLEEFFDLFVCETWHGRVLLRQSLGPRGLPRGQRQLLRGREAALLVPKVPTAAAAGVKLACVNVKWINNRAEGSDYDKSTDSNYTDLRFLTNTLLYSEMDIP